MRRLTSAPRTIGTMQKVHELSQPIWMVTQAAWATSRRARERRGVGVVLLHDLEDRALRPGPFEQRRRVGQVVGPEHHVDVGCPGLDEVAVLLGQAAADGDLEVGAPALSDLRWPRVP